MSAATDARRWVSAHETPAVLGGLALVVAVAAFALRQPTAAGTALPAAAPAGDVTAQAAGTDRASVNWIHALQAGAVAQGAEFGLVKPAPVAVRLGSPA